MIPASFHLDSSNIGTILKNTILVTKGRKTNKSHKVALTGVVYSGRIYFSRHKPNSDWYLNAAANSDVTVQIGNNLIAGTAHVVSDPKLLQRISELKYPGEARAKEKRVAIEVSLIISGESKN